METLVTSWTSLMNLYELAFYPSNHVLDPIWRQDMFVILSMIRLGITNSQGTPQLKYNRGDYNGYRHLELRRYGWISPWIYNNDIEI